MKRILPITLCLLALTLFACREPAKMGAALAALEPGWQKLAPDGAAVCSNDTPYAFFVRSGDPEKLLVHFEGGGACSSGETCDLEARPTYKPTVGARENVTARKGIFDLDNPENPFADYSMVFVPYCTGDVHLGDRVTTYDVAATDSTEAHTVTIQHKGNVNAMAVLSWTYENFLAPQAIFVSGSSAGAIPSPMYASLVADHYPEARVAQLGDAAGGYRGSSEKQNDVWGVGGVLARTPGFESVDTLHLPPSALYIQAALRHPNLTFARYDTAEDEVQHFFMRLAADDVSSLKASIDENREDIDREVGNVRSYVAGGKKHTILSRPEFYTYEVDGLRFRDWVASLVAGESVASVSCVDCTEAQLAPDAD